MPAVSQPVPEATSRPPHEHPDTLPDRARTGVWRLVLAVDQSCPHPPLDAPSLYRAAIAAILRRVFHLAAKQQNPPIAPAHPSAPDPLSARLDRLAATDPHLEHLLTDASPLPAEQLGHIYEALLDTTTARAKTTLLGLRGARGPGPDLPLDELERLAAAPTALLAHLRRATGRATAPLRRALATRPPPTSRARQRLLRACADDEALCARVEPWAALLRHDADGLPVVIAPGRLHLTPSPGRRATGTHYTPPELADAIVRHALEPLCHVGPTEGLPRTQWRLRPPAELLELRVLDLAMGCGAFLIAACRYLAARLLESALANSQHDPYTRQLLAAADRPLRARQLVAAHCLYGVDRDPLAVDIARRSLWLETRPPDPPATYLDQALKCGDSLLGLSSLDQLVYLHLDPARGRELHDSPLRLAEFTPAELRTLADAITASALHAARPGSSPAVAEPASLPARKRPPAAITNPAASITDPADLPARVLACPTLDGKLALVRAALHHAAAAPGEPRAAWFAALADLARRQLGEHPGGAPRTPFHWPLAFPDVLRRGGFSAVVGNPPFQGGQKISGTLGADYRDALIHTIAGGRRGSADLCAYFFLRAAALTCTPGQIGLLATNTIAQGDTREVGLDQLTAAGLEIERAIASAPWPGVANLEVAHVWLRKGPSLAPRVLDHRPVPAISPGLTHAAALAGPPHRLAANAGRSFIGSYVLGLGFVLTPDEARELLARAPESRAVVFPYINGDDLNSTVDQSPTRWVIDFRDRPLSCPPGHVTACAEDFPACLAIVRERVYPERQRNHRHAYRTHWWHHAEKRPLLYQSLAGMRRVLLRALTSKHHAFAFAPTGWVYDQTCPVYLFDDDHHFALLQSSLHHAWALRHGASLETRPRYTPSDCFETFPFPRDCTGLAELGARYDAHRRALMRAHGEGLTRTYNRFHDPGERGRSLAALRELHVALDRAVARAYGWSDLDLGHDFHRTAHGVRFTLAEPARHELLARLLALNHARHAEERAAGLHRPARRQTG